MRNLPSAITQPTVRAFAVLTVAVLAASGCGGGEEAPAEPRNPLLYPKSLTETAPETFRAHFETTAGNFVIEVHRDWAPLGADRFYNLVKNGFYDDHRIYRVVEGFMVQFGIHPVPLVDYQWQDELLMDDPVVATNSRAGSPSQRPEPTPARWRSSSITGTTRTWTPGALRPSGRWWRAWKRWTPSTPSTATAPPGERVSAPVSMPALSASMIG